MRKRWGLLSSGLAVFGLIAACASETETFICAEDAECTGGVCEEAGFCGFPDAGCESGRRYGELSGSLSLQCVPPGADTGASSGTSGASASSGTSASSGASATAGGTSSDATDTAASSGGDESTGSNGPCLYEDFDMSLGEWAALEGSDSGVYVENSELFLDLTETSETARQLGIEHPEPHDLNVSRAAVLLTNIPSTEGFYTRFSVHPYSEDAIYLDVRNGEVTAAELISTNTIVQGRVSLEDYPPPLLLQIEASPQSIVASVSSASGGDAVLLDVTDPIWLEEATARLVAGGPAGAAMSAFRYDFIELCIED